MVMEAQTINNKCMGRIKIQTLEIAGLRSVLEALRLPYGKECRSKVDAAFLVDKSNMIYSTESTCVVSPKDLILLSTLVKRGDEHAKVLRGLIVYAKIEAPVWLYRELETYRVGRERLSSASTMHIECKGLSGEELEDAKDNIPMGYIQATVDMYSYQALRRIWQQRHNHRLPAWHDSCHWIESLPFAKELILKGLAENEQQ